MVAPGGSTAPEPRPTRAIAALLSTQAWPERWPSLTGWWGTASSRSHRVG